MTMAVCFKCGDIKFGAFVPCPKCAGMPQTEDELALSLAMTDHYFDMPTLEQMGASVREGKPPHLGPETHAQLIEMIRGMGLQEKLKTMSDMSPPPDPSLTAPPVKKPWWKFW